MHTKMQNMMQIILLMDAIILLMVAKEAKKKCAKDAKIQNTSILRILRSFEKRARDHLIL